MSVLGSKQVEVQHTTYVYGYTYTFEVEPTLGLPWLGTPCPCLDEEQSIQVSSGSVSTRVLGIRGNCQY
jgi:hypothetical protein